MKPKWKRRQQLQNREMTEALRAEAQRLLSARRNLKVSIQAFVSGIYGPAAAGVAQKPTEPAGTGEVVADEPA